MRMNDAIDRRPLASRLAIGIATAAAFVLFAWVAAHWIWRAVTPRSPSHRGGLADGSRRDDPRVRPVGRRRRRACRHGARARSATCAWSACSPSATAAASRCSARATARASSRWAPTSCPACGSSRWTRGASRSRRPAASARWSCGATTRPARQPRASSAQGFSHADDAAPLVAGVRGASRILGRGAEAPRRAARRPDRAARELASDARGGQRRSSSCARTAASRRCWGSRRATASPRRTASRSSSPTT